MKIVFFGTPHLGAEILKRLIASRHEVIAVVTQPDRASGRGKVVNYSPAKETALEAGIPVLQPEKISAPEALDEIEALGADLHVVAAYAQKLPERLLKMAPMGCINVHPSLLPKYRGAAPLTAAILAGDSVSGVTIMQMAEKMDAGDIYMQEEMPLDPHETNASIEEKAVELGGRLLLETIDRIEAGTAVHVPQDESGSTYIKQIKKEEGLLDFSQDADSLERRIRAFDPWPGTYTYLDGKTFKICSAEVEDIADAGEEAVPGTVTDVTKKSFLIACGQGFLRPLSVQLEGKKKMSTEEFLRGRKLEQGMKLG